MTQTTDAAMLTEWARLLVDSFAAAGVTQVVISPGSRSTPFVAAAIAHPGLTCMDALDERAAAFFALGQGRVTGRPSLLLCTSGTAGAHYLPAIIEAGQSHTPLLALTADRPLELAHCAAPQTIDQVKLFGDHVRRFFELGAPDPSPGALRALRRTIAQAVFTATWPLPGAVHLNARARKPLEPYQPPSDAPPEPLRQRVDELLRRPPSRPLPSRLAPRDEHVEVLAEACRGHHRGLILCGPAPLGRRHERAAVLALAAATGYPLLAETTSQLRHLPADLRASEAGRETLLVDAFDLLLHSPGFRRRHAPEVVLQLGPPPTSGALPGYLDEHPDCRRFVIAPGGWNDPASSAEALLFAEVGDAAGALAASLGPQLGAQRRQGPWWQGFHRANGLAWQAADEVLAAEGDALSEGFACRATLGSLGDGELLALGNSLPIRHADTWCPALARDLAVWCQRGANGIDGLIAGSAGATTQLNTQRGASHFGTLLLGDVSFLHDLGGLGLAAQAGAPLVIVVLHNDGGRIFEQLPIARSGLPPAQLGHWTTPHGLELAPAAQLWRLHHARVSDRPSLQQALVAARAAVRESGRPAIVEVIVPPHAAAEQSRRLWQAVDGRVGEPA